MIMFVIQRKCGDFLRKRRYWLPPRCPSVPEYWKTHKGAEKRLKHLQKCSTWFAKDAEVQEMEVPLNYDE